MTAPPDPPARPEALVVPVSAPEGGVEHSAALLAPLRREARSIWHWLRYVVGLGLGVLGVYALTGRSAELSGAATILAHLDPGWLWAAIVAEALSYLTFAAMQRRLLLAAKVPIGITAMTGITLASTAIQDSLPGGVVLSAIYSFRQFRIRGASEVVAAWAMIAITVVSDMTLVVLAAVGLGLAASAGSAYDLVEVILGLALLVIVVIIVWLRRAWLIERAATPLALIQRVVRRPRGDPQELVDKAVARLGAMTPTRRDWIYCAGCALSNWLMDMACLCLAFWAVDAPIPWRGLLLAYTAGQLAANLPITPGGLGVVEGSLTIALVAFGGGRESTVAAVLLYRIISFWAAIPVGWFTWGSLGWLRRRAVKAAGLDAAAAMLGASESS